ncbi:molybdopterin synthase [Methanocella sp. CWC-04]|uniref:Molybdopterin synthase n=1 Tax=Methanooceanicella nereidis TaxID=2052831 RepID=A0AAP2RA97_9EURY|nr:molybdopterin synthase [Methanocella sp. CWC-04]MCD1293806.1 molybdopterin synthase [Methanocella sp. CWC-04]
MKVISIVGYKKTGKTTLVERLVSELSKYGTVGTVKHTREEIFPIMGDTERHLESGAQVVVGVTPTRSAKIMKMNDLKSALKQLSQEGLDFAVVEGFKDSDVPKIAIGDVEASNIVARVDINASAGELAKIAMAQPDHVSLDYLIAKIKKSPKVKEAGAIGTFTGIVREVAGDEVTEALEFESYDEVMRQRIKAIEDDLKKKDGILDVLIHHKTGRIEAGDDIVYIVILSGHRQELFPALSDAIERIKDEVPIWKKEFTVSREFWVHDHHDH